MVVAEIAAAVRGSGQPNTTAAECRLLDAGFLTDLYQVQKL